LALLLSQQRDCERYWSLGALLEPAYYLAQGWSSCYHRRRKDGAGDISSSPSHQGLNVCAFTLVLPSYV